MKNKLSYIIASNKSNFALENTIKSITDLDDSNYEIIVCSKNKIKESSNIKWVEDDKNNGSVYGFNKAYKESQNDYVIILPDDHCVKQDFLKIKDYFSNDDFQSLDFRICNLTHHLGGPEKNYYDKRIKRHTGNIWPDNPLCSIKNGRPYNVWHFFAIERLSIEKHMENVIFNTCFIHHWVDHWLGFYEEMINGERPTEKLGPDIYMECNQKFNSEKSNLSFDNYDESIFKSLVSISHLPNTTYNFQL
jgi:hypothetical protein